MSAASELPKLSDSGKRKLELRWRQLLDDRHLTGEHLEWHEKERNRQMRINAQTGGSSGGGWGGSSGSGREPFDGTGLAESVDVAETRFNDLAQYYWGSWVALGVGYETFSGWLETLRRHVLQELEPVWKGAKPEIDRWYERACRPALEKALATLVEKWTRVALARELNRLAKPTVQASVSLKESVPAAVCPVPDGCTWDQVTIRFTDDFHFQVSGGMRSDAVSYTTMGFEDRRGTQRKPVGSWILLREFAKQNGDMKRPEAASVGLRIFLKSIQDLRKKLRVVFGIIEDPIEFDKKAKRYTTKFTVEFPDSERL